MSSVRGIERAIRAAFPARDLRVGRSTRASFHELLEDGRPLRSPEGIPISISLSQSIGSTLAQLRRMLR